MFIRSLPHITLLACLGLSGAAFAQTGDPSPQQIIDALKPAQPQAQPAPVRRTRSLGVEAVEPAPAEAGATATTTAAVPPSPPSAASTPNQQPAPVSAAAIPAPPATPSISLSIQFEVNSDKVRPASLRTLANLAAALQAPELAKLRFRVEGHTDATGQAAYNRKLSAQRAEQVKQVLVSQRISPDRLVTEGKGSSELLNSADPAAAENRRVRIVSLGQ